MTVILHSFAVLFWVILMASLWKYCPILNWSVEQQRFGTTVRALAWVLGPLVYIAVEQNSSKSRICSFPSLVKLSLNVLSACRVLEHSDSNRMTTQNIGIVFGPTLMRPERDNGNMAINMIYQNQAVELILHEFDYIFGKRGLSWSWNRKKKTRLRYQQRSVLFPPHGEDATRTGRRTKSCQQWHLTIV